MAELTGERRGPHDDRRERWADHGFEALLDDREHNQPEHRRDDPVDCGPVPRPEPLGQRRARGRGAHITTVACEFAQDVIRQA